MTEAFQIILAVVYFMSVIALAVGLAWLYSYFKELKGKREQLLIQGEELKTTLAAMNKFHNDNIAHKANVDKLLKEHTQQISALNQSQAAIKPSFMR